MLNEYVLMGGMVGYILSVFHLWPIHQQFHYLVFLNGLRLCILLVVVFDIGVVL